MSKYYNYFLLFNCLFTFGQQKINITNEARYELTFKEYKNQKPEFLKNTFILLFNEKESFLKNMSLYVRDSLVDNGKIKKTGDSQKDFPVFSKYVPDLPYIIYKKENTITFSNEIPFSGEYQYTETIDFKWKITKESKTINGIKCIKATTTKWSRNWIAFYSPKHPMPYGPYKFYGLPGLIFEVYDDAQDYTFTLYKFKNRVAKNLLMHNYPKAKKVTKKQYEKARKVASVKPSTIIIEGYPTINKKIDKYSIDKEKNYNPVELTD